MTHRNFNFETDLETAVEWYALRAISGDPDPLETHSPFGTVVLDEEGDPIAMAWVFLCIGCEVSFCERLISRPGLDTETIRRVGVVLTKQLKAIAKVHGKKYLFSHVERPVIVAEMSKLGFERVTDSATLMRTTL